MFGRTYHSKFLSILIILAIFLILIQLHKKYCSPHEGFSQSVPFIIKRNDDIYDQFYAQIYDQLYDPKVNADFVADLVVQNTLANTSKSVILVIGCETGNQINSLQLLGFNTFVIDKSQDMVDYALNLYPNIQAKVGDFNAPMSYDKSSFSHIICTGFLLYSIKDKLSFFRNVFHWLLPNGYFILQLADPSNFDTITPAGRSLVLETPHQYSKERITETDIDFGNFRYISRFDFSENLHNIVFKSETFTDKNTHYVRKHEQTFYMENIESLLYSIQYCGFIIKGLFNLKTDQNQYIYILERPH